MAQASAKIEQHISKSSQMPGSKREDGVRSHPSNQPLPSAKLTGAKKPDNGNHRRSLLPKKTSTCYNRSTRALHEHKQRTSAVMGSNAQVIPGAFSNPDMKKKLIPSRSTEKENLSSSKAQKVPVKSLERSFPARTRGVVSRSLPTSQKTRPRNLSTSLGLQSSSSAGFGTAISSVKKSSASASNVSSICPGTFKISIDNLKDTTARTSIRSETQSAQSSGGVLGPHRTSSHQIVKKSRPEGTLLRPKDALFQKLPVKVDVPPLPALQQDFAPKKSFKPATRSLAHPTSVGPEPKMLPDQIVYLQMELMQLCILHHFATETQRQWEQSAERILHYRFDVIREEHNKVKRLVRLQKVSEAQAALVSWCGNMTSAELAAKVQLLSRNISDTWQLINPDGKYTRIIRIFEKWFDRTCGVQSSRKRSIQFMEEIHPIKTIEDGWALEVENMESTLKFSLRDLEHIGGVPEQTDFGHILFSFKNLLRNLMDELGIIRAIQVDIMASEISWIQTCIDDITQAGTMISDDIKIFRVWGVAS